MKKPISEAIESAESNELSHHSSLYFNEEKLLCNRTLGGLIEARFISLPLDVAKVVAVREFRRGIN